MTELTYLLFGNKFSRYGRKRVPLRIAHPADSPSGAVMSLTNAPEAVPPDTGERPPVHAVDEVLPAPRRRAARLRVRWSVTSQLQVGYQPVARSAAALILFRIVKFYFRIPDKLTPSPWPVKSRQPMSNAWDLDELTRLACRPSSGGGYVSICCPACPASRPLCQPASRPLCQPASRPLCQPASRPLCQPASRPLCQPGTMEH